MKPWHSFQFALLLAFTLPDPALAGEATSKVGCETWFQKLFRPSEADPKAAYRALKARVKAADASPPGSPPELRLKQLTGNSRVPSIPKEITESADPTRPYLFQRPDGKWVYRRDASGFTAFEADTLDQMLHGGEQNSARVPVIRRYADGTIMGPPYHTGNPAWDGLVARWPIKNEKGEIIGYKNVGYGGAMEQPYKLLGAKEAGIKARRGLVSEYNYTRSRWAFDITYDEKGREVWTGRGSIFGHKPSIQRNEWISPTHEHGYGGRPWVDADGTVREFDGTPWMIYERVTETRDGMPTRTECFARRMKNPYEVYKKGEKLPDGKPADEEVLIASTRPLPTKDHPIPAPYKATDRRGMGELVEGFNIKADPVEINGKKYWVGTGSAGNYVDDYGIYLGYRKFEDGPIGFYQWALDDAGEMNNFAKPMAQKYGLTWTGRADFFDVQHGRFEDGTHTRLAGSELAPAEQATRTLASGSKPEPSNWMIFHAVDVDTLPEGFPHWGWPTREQFEYFFRNQYETPIRYTERNGQPWLEILDEGDEGREGPISQPGRPAPRP